MITSDRQLNTAKEQLERLKSAESQTMGEHIPQPLIDAHFNKLKLDIQKIQSEIDEYEQLKSTSIEHIKITSIDDLLKAPIYYRIAKRMSVDEFARHVNISPRQIQRYESTEYQSTSITNLKQILDKINIGISGNINGL